MVISRDNAPKQVIKTDEELKEELLESLRLESVSILALAHMYARRLEETGADITEKWTVALEQNAVLQRVYNKGYVEGLQKGRELEREKINQSNNTATSRAYISVDEFIRQNTVQQPRRNVVQPANAQHSRKSTKKRHKR